MARQRARNLLLSPHLNMYESLYRRGCSSSAPPASSQALPSLLPPQKCEYLARPKPERRCWQWRPCRSWREGTTSWSGCPCRPAAAASGDRTLRTTLPGTAPLPLPTALRPCTALRTTSAECNPICRGSLRCTSNIAWLPDYPPLLTCCSALKPMIAVSRARDTRKRRQLWLDLGTDARGKLAWKTFVVISL
jgi:hypothetical protein